MEQKVKPIPEGYHTITPGLVIKDGARAIEFYKKAFDATEIYRMDSPSGALIHAELKIGDSHFMLGSEKHEHPGHDESCAKSPSELKGTTVNFYLYVEDSDAAFKSAVKAGGQAMGEMQEMFWGDRIGNIRDPFGYLWTFATHKVDVTPEEMKERATQIARPAEAANARR
ncbi:MAG: hypothetical protein A2X86_15705 [Bdellovibrionales bacterium GWA2_49_15]|nr:MAG: hypothetical protein A2X86_15705 [Bdellovibrionales bacterium GWA2_49_15]HAZ14576.1 glyoxalase [Bdellovibrionales bacterium]